jgi:hypothetical protein
MDSISMRSLTRLVNAGSNWGLLPIECNRDFIDAATLQGLMSSGQYSALVNCGYMAAAALPGISRELC